MWFFGLIVVLLIGAVAVVASGRWGAMAPAYDDRPDLTVPARQALTADDIETARFGVGLRGYRMDEVDTLLERVAREVAERDRRIADLERAVSPIIHGPEGAGFTSRSEYAASDFEDTGYTKPILVGGDFPDSHAEAAPEPPTAEQPAVEQPQAPQPEPEPLEESSAAADQFPAPQPEPDTLEQPAVTAEQHPAPQPQPETLEESPAPAEQFPAPQPQPDALEMPPAAAQQYPPPQPQPETLEEAPAPAEQYWAPQHQPEFEEPLAPAPPPPAPEPVEEPAPAAEAEPWFRDPVDASALDDPLHPPSQVPPPPTQLPPAQIPLPPLLQELVHPAEAAEPEPWFQAKTPPPDHTQQPPAPEDPTDDESDEDGNQRGRHSAAPDVNVAHRPN